MIVFDLQCDKSHRFEAWFGSNMGFEEQANAGQIACPFCDSHSITKAPMAPNIVSSVSGHGQMVAPKQESVSLARTENEQALHQALRQVQDILEKNTVDVGRKFAEEARKIHYGEAEKQNIRGTTTAKEAKELKEEGVEFFTVPDIRKLEN